MIKPAFVDLSHWNVVPQSLAPAAASGILGVIHKATEGTGYIDGKVAARFHMTKSARMLWGVYHFIRHGNIGDQVEHFLNVAASVSDEDTLYCLDYEDAGATIADALEFLEHVELATGHSPVLYSGHVLKEALGGKPNAELARFRLWLAQYTSGSPTLPPGWSSYWGWQYTESGQVPGINPPVDLNAFDGTAEDLRSSWSGAAAIGAPIVTVAIEAPPGVEVRLIVNGKPCV